MAHTRKFLITTLSRDFKKKTLEISVYSSGGVTHSAWLRVLNNDGEVIRTQVATRRHNAARKEVITWAMDYLDSYSEHEDIEFISTRRLEQAISGAEVLESMLEELAAKYEDTDQSRSEYYNNAAFDARGILEFLQEESPEAQ